MEQHLTPFWFWWWVNLTLVLWQFSRTLQKPEESLGFPTVVGLMWLYFFAFLPFHLVRNLPGVIEPMIVSLAECHACLAYASLLAGWHYRRAAKGPRTRSEPAPVFDYARLWCGGLALLSVGLAAYYSFKLSGRSFEETSAYWYASMNLCYPGISICVAVLTLSKRHRTVANYASLVFLSALIILPFLLNARRGPTYAAISSIVFTLFIVRKKPPNPRFVFPVVFAAGALLLFFVASRGILYDEGGTWESAFEQLTVQDVIDSRSKHTGDNEFYNHCTFLEANLRTGLYQYGTTHLAMLAHWIPRSWWPGKPARGCGFLPSALEDLAAEEHSNLGTGGAWGIVQDTFNNYWWFFPIFWLVLGWSMACLLEHAFLNNSLRSRLHYVGVLCATHWFVAQCLPEALVPALFFQGAYWLVLKAARIRTTTPRKRLRPRLAPHAPAPA